MTDECVLKVETEIPVNFTCATGTTIEKGAVCAMTDNMVAVLCTTDTAIVAGIAQSEKLAAETSQDSIAVYRGGIFRVTCSGSCPVGKPVTTGATANYVLAATANDNNILGIMLESGTEGQSKLMELRPTTMELS